MKSNFNYPTIAVVALVFCSAAFAQDELPVPGYGAAQDLEGSLLQPDPNAEYKVVFDASKAAANVDDVNPMLDLVARYVNTLAKWGVPAEKRKIAVVMHQGSGLIGLKNEAFKARNDGHDNPNIELIRSLHAAGVSFHLCGQGVLARKIDPEELLPEIQVDLWALTSLIEFGRQGYIRIGG